MKRDDIVVLYASDVDSPKVTLAVSIMKAVVKLLDAEHGDHLEQICLVCGSESRDRIELDSLELGYALENNQEFPYFPGAMPSIESYSSYRIRDSLRLVVDLELAIKNFRKDPVPGEYGFIELRVLRLLSRDVVLMQFVLLVSWELAKFELRSDALSPRSRKAALGEAWDSVGHIFIPLRLKRKRLIISLMLAGIFTRKGREKFPPAIRELYRAFKYRNEQ